MNILLAYSTKHFTPGTTPGAGGGMSASSAATLARTLYDTLSQYGQVDYVDGIKPPHQLPRQHYDLLVGIQGSITPLHRLAAFDRTVLFAVNMHPVERNRILRDFNDRYTVCPAGHVARNTVHLEQLDDIRKADAVFLVGNATVARSFLQHGKTIEQVRKFNYTSALPTRPEEELKASSLPRRILYVSTEMCLRKGFDILAELLRAHKDAAMEVGIIGGSGDKTYRRKLAHLQQTMGDKLTVHGWIDSSSEQYLQLLRSYDAVIFPSLEEGQAGSVLDAMSQGLVPLITRETGIDYSPLGFLEPAMHSDENKRLIQQLLHLEPEQLLNLQLQSLAYYQNYHTQWKTTLSKAFEQLISTGNPWPDIDKHFRVESCGSQLPKSLLYTLTDQLELRRDISCAAISGSLSCTRIRWSDVDALPENAITLSRIGIPPKPPFLLAEISENGSDTLSAPQEQPSNCSKTAVWFKAPLMRALSLLHPSKSQRKFFYNEWWLTKHHHR